MNTKFYEDKNFIEWLKGKFAKEYKGLDDDMPDKFEEWLGSFVDEDVRDMYSKYLKESV